MKIPTASGSVSRSGIEAMSMNAAIRPVTLQYNVFV
jgi:hypothetical protein